MDMFGVGDDFIEANNKKGRTVLKVGKCGDNKNNEQSSLSCLSLCPLQKGKMQNPSR